MNPHVAIVMDGNGRWAELRGLPRAAGHRAGAKAVERLLPAAAELGLDTLTLFAFSSDNWLRPRPEVDHLLQLFERYLGSDLAPFVRNGIELNVIGRRDRLPHRLVDAIERAERITAGGGGLLVRLAIDYSGRDAIARAHRAAGFGRIGREAFGSALNRAIHSRREVTDIDLLIRTGGESRLSDFLLWELAYAELVFDSRMWPEFEPGHLAEALEALSQRQRRFGRLPSSNLASAVGAQS